MKVVLLYIIFFINYVNSIYMDEKSKTYSNRRN